jgi:hypothetical protein
MVNKNMEDVRKFAVHLNGLMVVNNGLLETDM